MCAKKGPRIAFACLLSRKAGGTSGFVDGLGELSTASAAHALVNYLGDSDWNKLSNKMNVNVRD
jgi:hypothetical protein